MSTQRKRAVALIENMFFAVKVDGAARHLGLATAFAKDADEFRTLVREAPADLVIVDLACTSVPWEQLVRELKANPATAAVPVLAFGKHTQAERFKLARQAGCDKAITNAQFSEQLPALLQEYLGGSTAPAGRQED